MCVVSMVMDHYGQKWGQPIIGPIYPTLPLDIPPNPIPNMLPSPGFTYQSPPPPVTREEFEALRKDVLEMKELVKRALEYDRKHDQPDCENADKVAMIRKVAEMVGVNVDDVFGVKGA